MDRRPKIERKSVKECENMKRRRGHQKILGGKPK
jgi:hypothetical protein